MSHFAPCKKDGHYDYFGECLICEIENLHDQIAALTEALECLLPYIEPYSRDITGLYTKRPEVAKAEAVLGRVKP